MNFLLDTNVISETRRKSPDTKVLAWLAGVDPADLFISVMTLGEIAKGVATRARQNPEQRRPLNNG